jgi:nuclear pore complex protein Nup160
MGDILNQELDANDGAKPVIHPSHSQLVKVFGDSEESALCVTYSPLGTGQFKFWNVSPAEEGNLDVIDLFPNNSLEPRTPTSDLWTLADFSVLLDRTNINSFTLWTLWKNNTTYRVMKLDFRSGSFARVRDGWNDGWVAIANETLREAPLPMTFQGEASDSTDKWLQFILSPGKFTSATIETGLAIYKRGLGSSKATSPRSESLAQRMCSTIASTATLGRKSNGHMDYEQFRAATDTQWRRFYRLLVELDKQRGEALSLVVDPQGQMPWVILADGVAAVRDCSGLERIWHNQEIAPLGAEHVATLVTAAASFRDSLSDQLLHSCRTTLLWEIYEEPSQIDPVRMRLFYDKCDFANQIGEEEYSQLVNSLGGNFNNVTPQVYDALLELMNPPEDIETRPQKNLLAEFGNKLIVKGVQETVELHRNLCLDQLILLVLIEGEINHGEEGIQFETAAVFSQLLKMLKALELIKWLSSCQIALDVEKPERRDSVTDKAWSLKKPTIEKVTVLEGILRHLLSLDTRRDEPMSSALTEVIIQICVPDSVYELSPAAIQCFLLKRDGTELAVEFSRFAGRDPFSTYVQGRTCLAANDALTAAIFFKRAAFGMGMSEGSYLNTMILTVLQRFPILISVTSFTLRDI